MRGFGNSWPDIPCSEIVARRMNRAQRSTSRGSRKGTQLGQAGNFGQVEKHGNYLP